MTNQKKLLAILFKLVLIALVFYLIYYLFIFRECASCAFVHNDLNYNGYCPELCYKAPKWKIILFEITGNNYGYKY